MLSFILQFQFHKGACVLAGQYDPKNSSSVLSDCDISGSQNAGNAMKSVQSLLLIQLFLSIYLKSILSEYFDFFGYYRQMLSLGSSKQWPEALEIVTGQRKMTADALLEYFKPLQTWLEKKNQETGAHVGWDSEYRKFKKSFH